MPTTIPPGLDPDLAKRLAGLTEFAELVMPMYIESARNYAQLAVGALAISVAFREKVLGHGGPMRPTTLLIVSWISLLVSIASSAWYQYVAIKLIHMLTYGIATGVDPYDLPQEFPLTIGWLWPGNAYGLMVAAFFLGAMFLVLASVSQILRATSAAEPKLTQPSHRRASFASNGRGGVVRSTRRGLRRRAHAS